MEVQILKYMGLVSLISGWLVIVASIARNPWFVFTQHAFSDLGGQMANDPWLFNNGMILTGFFIILYGFYLIRVGFNKASIVGGTFMLITGIFLILIGVFPSGSMHHVFVSYWFFTQGDLTILAWSLGLISCNRWRKYGIFFLVLSLGGPILAYIIKWPSIATVEAYGIVILNIWVLLMIRITPYLSEKHS